MATTLTEAEKLTIGTILGIDFIDLDYHISYYDTRFTAASDTAIRAELTRWTTAGFNFLTLEPREANLGARIDPQLEKNDIRKNLSTLLYLQDSVNTGSRLVRC